MTHPTPERPNSPATAYRPPGPHDQPHPSATVHPVPVAPVGPSLDWRMGVQPGTWAANACGRTYVIGRGSDGWWWAHVDHHRVADRRGQTAWGIKTNAQAACAQHVADHPLGGHRG